MNGRASEDDEATPKPRGWQVPFRHSGREGDGIRCRAHSGDPRAAFDHERWCLAGAIIRICENLRPRGDRQNGGGLHEHLAGHEDGAGPCLRRRDGAALDDAAINIPRRPGVVVQPREPGEPVAGAEGASEGHGVEESVVRRRVGAREEVRVGCRPGIHERVGRSGAGALQQEARVKVGGLGDRAGPIRAIVEAELVGRARRENHVIGRPEQQIPVDRGHVAGVLREARASALAEENSIGGHVGDHDVSEHTASALAEAHHGGRVVVAGDRVRIVVDVANEVG
eukprot:scaffold7119_cov384-Pinguiococcus_pyrenoidosus.AAC.1